MLLCQALSKGTSEQAGRKRVLVLGGTNFVGPHLVRAALEQGHEVTLDYLWMNNWLTQSLYTYLLLTPGADAAALEAKLPAFMRRHFAERVEQQHLYLQPLPDVYLGSSQILHGRVRQGNRTYVMPSPSSRC